MDVSGNDVELFVRTLGPALRSIQPIVGQLGQGFTKRLEERAETAAADATISWTRRALRLITLQGRHPSDPESRAVTDRQIEETLTDLAAQPDHASTQRLLVAQIMQLCAEYPGLLSELKSLTAGAPSALASNAVNQTVSNSWIGGSNLQVGGDFRPQN